MPFWQNLASRYLLLPLFFRKTSWDQAQEFFQRQGQKILKLAEGRSSSQLTTPALIDPIVGIEDSSRYWSVAMVMEHLVIVGDLMAGGIVDLTFNRISPWKADVAAVKPQGNLPAEKAIQNFKEFLARFRRRTMEEAGNRRSKIKFLHPWFGKLTAHQWLCVGALHNRVHRLQAEAIMEKLEAAR